MNRDDEAIWTGWTLSQIAKALLRRASQSNMRTFYPHHEG